MTLIISLRNYFRKVFTRNKPSQLSSESEDYERWLGI